MARVLLYIAAVSVSVTVATLLLLSHGLYQANLPSPPVTEAQIRHEGGRLLTLRDGRRLEYFDSGTPGPVLLAIHGGMTTGWGYQGPALPAGARVISPTFPGFGASSSHNGRTILSFGDDVQQLMDHLQIQSFVLAGVSWGGPHSAAIALAMPERVLAWLLLAPVVTAMTDFPGWTSLIPDARIRLMHHHLLPTPYINRAVIKYIMRPIFSKHYSPAVWRQLGAKDPRPSFNRMPAANQQHLFLDMGRSIRWNLDGMPDIAETTVQKRDHLDYPLLGRLLGGRPVRIHMPRNDTIVHPSCSQYMFDKLAAGGASNLQLIPSEGEEGHFYAVSHFGPALKSLLAELAAPQAPGSALEEQAEEQEQVEGGAEQQGLPEPPVAGPPEAAQHQEL